MSQQAATLPDNGLRSVSRYITDHDSKGHAIISNELDSILPWQEVGGGARFSLAYATDQFPVELSEGKDVQTYTQYLAKKPGLTIPGGTVLRYVDVAPGHMSPMHRTISLDYGVVMEGEVELILDSGDTRLLKRGDIAIQRATNHAWRNASKTEWARMLYVLQQSEALKLNGSIAEEDYGVGMGDVPPSGRT